MAGPCCHNHYGEEEPPVIIGERPYQNQNPLQLLELLVKGFCPPVIRDRVEIHEEVLIVAATPSSTPKVPLGEPTSSYSRLRRHHELPNRAVDDLEPEEKPFEIGERPPSDVIGISKKIWEEKVWEGFCYNTQHRRYSSNNEQQQQQHQEDSPPGPLIGRGWCSIWMDRKPCPRDKEMDFLSSPEGEECSVTSSDGSAGSVDLTPQSSPLCLQYYQQSDISDYYDCDPSCRLFELNDGECDYEAIVAEEEDEEEVIVELLQAGNHRKMVNLLLATLVALWATFALLQTRENKVHFEVKPKHNNSNFKIIGGSTAPSSPTISIAPKSSVVHSPSAPTHAKEVLLADVGKTWTANKGANSRLCWEERVLTTFQSPFGQAFLTYLEDEQPLFK